MQPNVQFLDHDGSLGQQAKNQVEVSRSPVKHIRDQSDQVAVLEAECYGLHLENSHLQQMLLDAEVRVKICDREILRFKEEAFLPGYQS